MPSTAHGTMVTEASSALAYLSPSRTTPIARPSPSRMHALAAERSAEFLGVLLFGEHEPESIGRRETPYARDGRRQFALVVEFPQRVEILVDALLLSTRPSAGAYPLRRGGCGG